LLDSNEHCGQQAQRDQKLGKQEYLTFSQRVMEHYKCHSSPTAIRSYQGQTPEKDPGVLGHTGPVVFPS